MSVIRRLTNLARGYVKTLGGDDAPSSEIEEPRPRPAEAPVVAEEASTREPPKPKKRTL